MVLPPRVAILAQAFKDLCQLGGSGTKSCLPLADKNLPESKPLKSNPEPTTETFRQKDARCQDLSRSSPPSLDSFQTGSGQTGVATEVLPFPISNFHGETWAKCGNMWQNVRN